MANYRNRALLDLAQWAPCCFGCNRRNDGTLVMAHSNQLRDGKGMGIKAHDFRVAVLCEACHRLLDQGSALSKLQRLEFWEEAHRATVGWLFAEQLVVVVPASQRRAVRPSRLAI